MKIPVPEGSKISQYNRDHVVRGGKGIDWAVPIGTPITAAAAGVVAIAEYSATYGNHVHLYHGSSVTIYGHLDRWIVSPGEKVVEGQVIGYSGNTGDSSGPHLHFEIRNCSSVNPEPAFGINPPKKAKKHIED
jgi:murein DD-endopeptidase MepM/ murein hydrolase activator NlpD